MEKYKTLMDSSWLEKLKPALEYTDTTIFPKLKEEREAGKVIYPDQENIFRAFLETPLDDVKVVMLGQNPYHDGSATGIAFDNKRNPSPTKENIKFLKKLSPSLLNVMTEMYENSGENFRGTVRMDYTDSHLGHLPKQGVLLLNSALTVEKGIADSHMDLWQPFTEEVIKVLNEKDNIVWMLFGAFALAFKEKITNPTHKFIITSHPSPFSAHRSLKEYPSFIGSKCFSTCNKYLEGMGLTTINW